MDNIAIWKNFGKKAHCSNLTPIYVCSKKSDFLLENLWKVFKIGRGVGYFEVIKMT